MLDPQKKQSNRGHLISNGCKNLGNSWKSESIELKVRVNGLIRAEKVDLRDQNGRRLGIVSLRQALAQANQHAVDLVETDRTATPPVCLIIDYGKFRFLTRNGRIAKKWLKKAARE
jgi:translation initiation factor IF-3